MLTVKEAEAAVDIARKNLAIAENKLHEARIAESPLKIGQIYKRERTRGYSRNAKNIIERVQIVRFDPRYGYTHAIGLLFKTNGELGLREVTVHNTSSWKLENATC